MSYDFTIYEVDGPPPCVCGRTHGGISMDLGSPTYNVGPIFRRASKGVFRQGQAMTLPDALCMFEMIRDHLAKAREDTAELDQLRGLEPPNGWGSIDTVERSADRCIAAIRGVIEAGGLDTHEWEPLESGTYDTDEEIAARPRRKVPVDNLRFQA